MNLPDSLINPILESYKTGSFETALRKAEEGLRAYPDSEFLFLLKGINLSALLRFEDAISSYERALQFKPDYIEALFNKANAESSLGKTESAIEGYIRCLNLKPNFTQALSGLARNYHTQGDITNAKKYYKKALESDERSPGDHNNLGNLYKSIGDHEQAISCYKKAIEISPDFHEAYSNLGAAQQELELYEQAKESYQRCLRIAPSFQAARHNLGSLLYIERNYAEAKQQLDQCVNNQKAVAQKMECQLFLREYDELFEGLKELSRHDRKNLRVAALSSFVCQQFGRPNPYPFCQNPIEMVYKDHLGKYLNQEMKEFIISLTRDLESTGLHWEPSTKTTRNGYRTLGNIFKSNFESITVLKKALELAVEQYRKAMVEGATSDVFLSHWPSKYSLKGWYNKLVQGGAHVSHIHSAGWLSGVVYLSVPAKPEKSEGAIEFSLRGYDYPILKDNVPTKLIQPKIGDIVLFPSSLFHRTVPTIGQHDRCAVAFDVTPST